MKNLQDLIQENLDIHESRISPIDIEHYIYSWMYEPMNKKEMKEYLNAICNGFRQAIDARNSYQTDPKAMNATEYLGQVEDALAKTI